MSGVWGERELRMRVVLSHISDLTHLSPLPPHPSHLSFLPFTPSLAHQLFPSSVATDFSPVIDEWAVRFFREMDYTIEMQNAVVSW